MRIMSVCVFEFWITFGLRINCGISANCFLVQYVTSKLDFITANFGAICKNPYRQKIGRHKVFRGSPYPAPLLTRFPVTFKGQSLFLASKNTTMPINLGTCPTTSSLVAIWFGWTSLLCSVLFVFPCLIPTHSRSTATALISLMLLGSHLSCLFSPSSGSHISIQT